MRKQWVPWTAVLGMLCTLTCGLTLHHNQRLLEERLQISFNFQICLADLNAQPRPWMEQHAQGLDPERFRAYSNAGQIRAMIAMTTTCQSRLQEL
jgi:hypothetical protein